MDVAIDKLLPQFNGVGNRRHHTLSMAWGMMEERVDPLLRITGPELRILLFPVSREGVKRRLVRTRVKFNDETLRQCQMSQYRRALREAHRGITQQWGQMEKVIQALREIKRHLKQVKGLPMSTRN